MHGEQPVNPGKRFEEKFRASMAAHAYVLRIPDNVHVAGGRIVSTETDADFLVQTGTDSYLVECKATNRPRLEYYNVKEHQEQALASFDALGERCHGFLAVEFYNKVSYRLPHRMFLLPIDRWIAFKEASGRKSMPLRTFSEQAVELTYRGSAYEFSGEWYL